MRGRITKDDRSNREYFARLPGSGVRNEQIRYDEDLILNILPIL
jgi:hypothetical protein